MTQHVENNGEVTNRMEQQAESCSATQDVSGLASDTKGN